MFIFKFLLLLFIFGDIDAGDMSSSRPCPYPRLAHGRVRTRQRSKLVKFICYPGYTLVGNKYATCRDGSWDVPMPVCVKPGCTLPEDGSNILSMATHSNAWVVFFCFPGYELVGSSAIFCDGRQWNDTVPECVGTKEPPKLSCDFENPNICGWVDDELHDFDWRRLNRKTPSSFLNTGPSFDHTYGEGGSGYYMYIESTSRLQNDTARLISPVYEARLAKDGCFSFYYHMFGQGTGGLRVYQKPETFPMLNLLALNNDNDNHKYLLFEKWGNQGDAWFDAVVPLRDFSDNFQIVIEGIRGRSYTSDIAIDDVAILQGENCTAAIKSATTLSTVVLSDSCSNRCENEPSRIYTGCGCSPSCETDGSCCPDYYDYCVFFGTSTIGDEMPETQKLVLSSTTTTQKTTTQQTTTTVATTKATTAPTTIKVVKTTTKIPAIKLTTKSEPKLPPKISMPPIPPVPSVFNTTQRPITVRTTKIVMTTKPTTMATRRVTKKEIIAMNRDMLVNTDDKKSESSGLKTTILTITGLLCIVGFVWLVVLFRGARGRVILSRMRGHAVSDPEVRYLNSDVDDD